MKTSCAAGIWNASGTGRSPKSRSPSHAWALGPGLSWNPGVCEALESSAATDAWKHPSSARQCTCQNCMVGTEWFSGDRSPLCFEVCDARSSLPFCWKTVVRSDGSCQDTVAAVQSNTAADLGAFADLDAVCYYGDHVETAGIDLAQAKCGHRFCHQQTTFSAWHRPPSSDKRFLTASPQVQAKEVATIREAAHWYGASADSK